jgi:MFS family permease
MGRSKKPPIEPRRKSSTLHYQTFPTTPPASRGRPPSSSPDNGDSSDSNQDDNHDGHHHETPLPIKQLAILAVIAIAEQTALNSISAYLPKMALTFLEVGEGQVGLYVGLIASCFALAQFTTNFFWGWLSDKIGRKPVILLGTVLTAACFIAFGFCRTLWQAILVQILMGLVNGNQGLVSTCLGEITDRSNQSRAFTYLPVVYGIGAITGPAVGGLLVFETNPFTGKPNPFPYVFPNLFSAAVLSVDLVVTTIFLEESLEEARQLPPLKRRIGSLFSWLWQFTGASHRPTYLRRIIGSKDDDSDADSTASITSIPPLIPETTASLIHQKHLWTRDTILILLTYFIFQLSNVAYNSLYPIFAEGPEPTGRDLSTTEVGLSLSFAGIITILFQIGIYSPLREKIGNRATYRASLALFVVAFLLIPFAGYRNKSGFGNGKVALWIELGVTLVLKTVAAVGGLTSALLLITNSAPNHQVLGSLNGLAQTLSAAGRAVGPFISGGLFSAATRLSNRGEIMPFGIFAGVACVGFGLSFGIRSEKLEGEADGAEEDGTHEEEDEDSTPTAGHRRSESGDDTPLLGRQR